MSITILPRPDKKQLEQFKMWVDEAIWGHRLYDEQTPCLTLLEFFGILQSQLESNQAFQESDQERNKLKYYYYPRLYIRNILFNNPHLETIASNPIFSDKERWQEWEKIIKETAGGIENPDFSYLQERFSSFSDFVRIVNFFQANAIEGDSNKRWTSKFVFPYGPDSLFPDLRVQVTKEKTNVSVDRRFFGRTGELLYLMLCRSHKGKELLTGLKKLGIIADSEDKTHLSKWNHLIKALQNKEDIEKHKESGSPPYLPYLQLPEYEALADDWLTILKYDLPDYDAIPHLVTLTGLHLIIYLLTRAKTVLEIKQIFELNNDFFPDQSTKLDNENPENIDINFDINKNFKLNHPVTFILEIVAPKKTVVRDLASASFLENNNLSITAVETYVHSVKNSDEWQKYITSNNDYEGAKEFLENKFQTSINTNKGISIKSQIPDEMLEEFCEEAVNQHKQHVANCHRVWGKEIGFISSRSSRRNRYAPNDAFLKTLVLANVEHRLEFQQFLTKLYEKYGFIIGDKQAKKFIENGEADQEAFASNAERLEQRLSSLGLLKRLSDACAYVQNPFAVNL